MLEPKSFRQIMSRFATGITVVTAFDQNQTPVGITINSFTSVSLAPPLALFCLDKKAHIFPIFEQLTHFAINILAADQENVSQHFADYRHHPGPAALWDAALPEAPLVAGTLGWMLCRKAAVYEGGDHMIYLGEVMRLHISDSKIEPLVYFHSKYRQLGNP
jgi:flavin reductase (DIM6/NTAB) family NADH-FMN oxidoreductase RutF